jgi:hypothetical protein
MSKVGRAGSSALLSDLLSAMLSRVPVEFSGVAIDPSAIDAPRGLPEASDATVATSFSRTGTSDCTSTAGFADTEGREGGGGPGRAAGLGGGPGGGIKAKKGITGS